MSDPTTLPRLPWHRRQRRDCGVVLFIWEERQAYTWYALLISWVVLTVYCALKTAYLACVATSPRSFIPHPYLLSTLVR